MLDIEPQNNHTLVKQQDALRVYLDSLFKMPLPEIPPEAELESPTVAETPDVFPLPLPVASEANLVSPATAEHVAPTLQPKWAHTPFSCLLVQVDGLRLAVPMAGLNSVKPWPTRFDQLPGASAWIIGVMRLGAHYVRVVDTCKLLSPKRKAQRPETEATLSRNILVFGQQEWGLACDTVKTVVSVDPTAVKWRASGAKRPWIVGTAVDHLCAILDLDRMASSLEDGQLLV